MTKNYEEYKSSGKKGNKWVKVMGLIVAVGLILLGVAFILMLVFPSYNGSGGWREWFK